MKSPFPGMDPYLESRWREVHHNLISFTQAELQTCLPAGVRAGIDVRDIHELRFVIETQGFIEIHEISSANRVISVIEFLCPSNKLEGDGRRLYLEHQRECLTTGINLIEIDLIRRGQHTLAVPSHILPTEARTANLVCVRRGRYPSRAEIYVAPLPKRLPTIPIPLRENENDVPLDLQRLIDRCYEQAQYGEDINYECEPDPPLDESDARWADELLRQAGRR